MNPSQHIEKLLKDGYSLEIREEKFLLINRVPYLNKNLELRYGIIVSTLEMNGNEVKSNPEHPVYFIGEQPYKANGIKLNPNNCDKKELLPGLIVDFFFSYKKNGQPYANYYEKMTHYFHIFSKHAIAIDPSVTFNIGVLVEVPRCSPFQYSDCNSATPEVNILLAKFSEMKIGIIGLGGTGSYILDYMAKTPVKEIHLFDGDYYHNKNAFRAPGATSIESLLNVQQKSEYFQKEYFKMHKGVISHPDNIRKDNMVELNSLSFFFLAIDKSTIKKMIVDHLEKNRIGFIDVGMGVNIVNGAILGQIRTTTSTEEKRDHIHTKNRIKFTENLNNDYSKVPQIAELNALNAAFAVIKWKKLVGFYHDRGAEYHSIYQLHLNNILHFDNENGT
ncbi:MAG: ThiF family adenylyltransferase [Minisyncoccia bacterium]